MRRDRNFRRTAFSIAPSFVRAPEKYLRSAAFAWHIDLRKLDAGADFRALAINNRRSRFAPWVPRDRNFRQE